MLDPNSSYNLHVHATIFLFLVSVKHFDIINPINWNAKHSENYTFPVFLQNQMKR